MQPNGEAVPAPATTAGGDRAAREDGATNGPTGLDAPQRAGTAVAVAESAGALSRPRYPPSPTVSRVTATPPPSAPASEPPARERASARQADKRLPDPTEFRFLKEEPRGPHRSRTLLAGMVLAAVLAVALVALITTGSSGSPSHTAGNTRRPSHAPGHVASQHAASATPAGPAALHVAVLNSTEVTGLAHHLAATLQEHGFSQAQALSAHPPGTYTASVVEYAPGYAGEAEGVARALGMEASALRPMEAATQPLTPGASVVVVAGSEAASGSTG